MPVKYIKNEFSGSAEIIRSEHLQIKQNESYEIGSRFFSAYPIH